MDIKKSPIGVFDSGIGGLTTVREIMKILPHENIVYLGDTARVPYGTRSSETIIKYARQDMDFLKRRGVKFMIAACGTVSSVMASKHAFEDEMCVGVIAPAAKRACEITKNGKIGVIATSASIKSGSYEKIIKQIRPDVTVIPKACPMFVPLVENGYTDRSCEPTRLFVEEYLTPLKEQGIDALLLGCTHYPLIADAISDFLGADVTLISSGAEAAKRAREVLQQKNLLNDSKNEGTVSLFCTDSAELFRENAARFIPLDGISIKQRSVDE